MKDKGDVNIFITVVLESKRQGKRITRIKQLYGFARRKRDKNENPKWVCWLSVE